MKHHRYLLLLIIALLFAGAGLGTQAALGQDATIPTRTPTPGAGNPDPTNEPDPTSEPRPTSPPNPDPTNEPQPTDPPAATATAVPVNTNTPTATAVSTDAAVATATALASITPAGGQIPDQLPTPAFPTTGVFPAANGCEDSPTITARVETAVFAGPGSDYPQIVLLRVNEVKPLLGRAQYAEWWLIQLNAAGATGWVRDSDVDEQGHTGRIPLVGVPELNGVTVTPGILWNPTPQPACITPTPTPTATAVTGDLAVDAVTGSTETATAVASATPTATATQPSVGADTAIPTAEPLAGESSSKSPNFLPIAGLGLLAAGVFAAFFIRSRGPKTDNIE